MPTTKLAFEFLVLTASRSSEVREATWAEMNLENAVWIVPKERMKNGREHREPLSDRALEILEEAPKYRDGSGLVFPGERGGRPMTDSTISKLCRENGIDGTPHGMRSSFRSWCAECTDYDPQIAEAALSHVNQNTVEAIYQRSDLLAKQGRLMEEWRATWRDRVTQSDVTCCSMRLTGTQIWITFEPHSTKRRQRHFIINMDAISSQRFIRMRDVVALAGISRASFIAKWRRGDFLTGIE